MATLKPTEITLRLDSQQCHRTRRDSGISSKIAALDEGSTMTHRTDELPGAVDAAPCRAPRRFSGRPTAASPREACLPRYRLEFDDGGILAVLGRGLIGRDPIAAAGDNVEHLVALADDTLSLSRTHLEFGVAESGLWVRDCNSTNGSQLETNGSRRSIEPGLRVDAPPGCTIYMGAHKVKVWPIAGRGEIGGATLDWGVASHVGPVHAHNQDAYCAAPPVFVVADGMGGHSAGDRASREAVDALSPLIGDSTVTGEMLDACLADTRGRIGGIPAGDGRPPGTTLSGVIVTRIDNRPFWMVVNIGDLRTYRLDSTGFRQISIDHSVVQELTDAGAITASAARSLPIRNFLTGR